MPETTLKDFTVKRSSIKGRITKFKNYLDLVSSMKHLSSIQLSELNIKLGRIEALCLEFDTIQGQIEVLNSSCLDAELSERENIEQELTIAIATAQDIASKHTSTNAAQANSSCSSSHGCSDSQNISFKLPQIQIPKFDGSFYRWLEFRDMFVSLIDKNDRIQPIHKFHYLNSYLEGDASRVISNLEMSDANYSKAWSLLCERYNNKRQLINNHLNSLFNIEPIARESEKSLRSLIDNVGKNLRALSSLGEPTDKWDTLIIHMVSSKLDAPTSLKWEEHRNAFDEMPTLEQFNKFLKDRADVLETHNNNKADKQKRQSSISSHSSSHKHEKVHSKSLSYTAQVIHNNQSEQNNTSRFPGCAVCSGPHRIYDCPTFLSKTPEQRIQEATKLKLCLNCLRPGHNRFTCRLGPCRECKRRHNSLCHKVVSPSAGITTASSLPAQTDLAVNFSSETTNQVYLATALIEVINPSTGKSDVIRAVFDCGSQTSFIALSVQQRLGLDCLPFAPVKVVGIGNKDCDYVTKSCVVQLQSLQTPFNVTMSCCVLPELTGELPKTFVGLHNFNLPCDIQLADPHFNKPSPIEFLIGADLFWDVIGNQQRSLGANKPFLRRSQFGWLVTGPIVLNNCEPNNKIQCNFSSSISPSIGDSLDQQISRFWELEELPKTNFLCETEEACVKHFDANTTRLPNGQFCVRLPLKDSPDCLGDSYKLAKKRFLGLEKRFRKQPQLKQAYSDFIKEYQDLGHCSESAVCIPEPNYFLCHHPVFRANSESTKIRVVFDGSAPTTSGISINDLQLIGPNIQDSIFSILLRFRQYKFVLTGDVAKMYRQVVCHEDDRNLQLILWREDESLPIKTLRLNTVTYGFASASYLSTRCLWQLGEECPDELTKTIIQHDFLVDDLLTGSDDVEQLIYIMESVTKTLNLGCFPLRKFRSNEPSIFQRTDINLQDDLSLSDSTSTLGLGWNPSSDKLNFSSSLPDKEPAAITKRTILSNSLKIFDPLGLLSPCTVLPKMLIQKLWIQNLGWDETVPNELAKQWVTYQSNANHLLSVSIPRHAVCDSPASVQLHTFCDSSALAYGACVYLRSTDAHGAVTVKLLCAKSKVAPIKPTTINRLELCGALLAARLCRAVTDSLRLEISHFVHWCDSTVTLGWLRSKTSNLKTFVANRVAKICEDTKASSWRHVPTHLNPADPISRGVCPSQISSLDLWWSGPSFLQDDESNWPTLQTPLEGDLPEIKVHSVTFPSTSTLLKFENSSNYTRLLRGFAYILRYIHNLKNPNSKFNGSLTLEEINKAYLQLIKLAQNESYKEEIYTLQKSKQLNHKSKLLPLDPFLDEEGILRVGGRLNLSTYDSDKRNPIIIDSKHHLTKLIFRHEHFKQMHVGPQSLLYAIKQYLWPIGGRELARRTYRNCVVCRRLQGRTLTPKMGNLPAQRVNPGFPFQTVGMDFAGPFSILDRKGRGARTSKCYLCLFICFRTKCVHLEAVSELSKEAFILSLRRFIARRGKPLEIFSDNGRNFVAAAKDIGYFLKSNAGPITDFAANEKIKFNFIPAYAPHFGGLWESAGIRSSKTIIKKCMGNANLTFEELSTLFAQVEAILNSRPLCPLSPSSSNQDFLPLSPGHFLIGRPLTSLPSPALEDSNPNSLRRYARLEQIRQHFWSRWQKEYISELQQRSKWRTNHSQLKIGDLVLIQEDNTSPLNWRLGRVAALFPGSDGLSRVADIDTVRGRIRRALTRLCPLPTQEEQNA